jgi:uncharacterized protein
VKSLRTTSVALAIALSCAAAAPDAATAKGASIAQAAANGDLQAVRSLLKTGVDVNAKEPDGSTALHYAANRGALDLVDALLTAGAQPNARNRYGVTPLSLACVSGNAAVVERLLKAGADVKGTTNGGVTALMTAARTGAADVIKVLLRYGADVNAAETTRQQTALMWAAIEGNVDAMKALIEGGANIKAQSNEVDFKNPDSAARMATVSDNANMKARQSATIKFTPFMFAIRAGHIPAAKLLLDAGVDVNEKLPDGVNGVILAIINAHYELAAYLLDKGANPNAASS